MREIIFRGKRLEDGEWVYGDVRHFKDAILNEDIAYIESFCEDGICKRNYHVAINTISQYTGITDKNGVKIFEHDIVAYDAHEDGIQCSEYAKIVWCEDMLGWKVKLAYAYEDEMLQKTDGKHFRVSGNIFDNPELMRG